MTGCRLRAKRNRGKNRDCEQCRSAELSQHDVVAMTPQRTHQQIDGEDWSSGAQASASDTGHGDDMQTQMLTGFRRLDEQHRHDILRSGRSRRLMSFWVGMHGLIPPVLTFIRRYLGYANTVSGITHVPSGMVFDGTHLGICMIPVTTMRG